MSRARPSPPSGGEIRDRSGRSPMVAAPRAEQAAAMTFAPPPHPSSVDQPTSAQAATPRRPQLQRSHTDTMLGGVCGGLAEYSGIETLLWRIGFVAAALLGPGVLVYLLLWVLMPPAPEVPAAELG